MKIIQQIKSYFQKFLALEKPETQTFVPKPSRQRILETAVLAFELKKRGAR